MTAPSSQTSIRIVNTVSSTASVLVSRRRTDASEKRRIRSIGQNQEVHFDWRYSSRAHVCYGYIYVQACEPSDEPIEVGAREKANCSRDMCEGLATTCSHHWMWSLVGSDSMQFPWDISLQSGNIVGARVKDIWNVAMVVSGNMMVLAWQENANIWYIYRPGTSSALTPLPMAKTLMAYLMAGSIWQNWLHF